MPTDPQPGQAPDATWATACTVERSERGMITLLVEAGSTREDMLALFDQGWARVMKIAGSRRTDNGR